jgi:hypothetical protein
MAFKCIRSTYHTRLFEEGVVYSSIGDADRQYFVEVQTKDDDGVVDSGLDEDLALETPVAVLHAQPPCPIVEELLSLGVPLGEVEELGPGEREERLEQARLEALGA